jgi:hypothetical protein
MAGSKLSKLADELEDIDDEPTGETNIIVQPGGVVHVEQTGKHKAMAQDDRPTPSDPPSQPAKARFALAVLDRIQPPWLRAPVVLFALAIVGLLVWRGVALTGIVP